MAVVVNNGSVNLRLILNDGVDVTIGARIKVVNSKSLLSKAFSRARVSISILFTTYI